MLRDYPRFVLIFVILSICGCRESALDGLVQVTGTVTYQGKPVDGADVVFNPEFDGHRAASARTDSYGKFDLTTLVAGDGAEPGNYKVAISKQEVLNPMSAKEVEDWFRKHPAPPPPSKIKNHLPTKYANDTTSGLTATVTKGQRNQLSFDLE